MKDEHVNDEDGNDVLNVSVNNLAKKRVDDGVEVVVDVNVEVGGGGVVILLDVNV